MGHKSIISVFALLVLFLSVALFEKLEFSVSLNRYGSSYREWNVAEKAANLKSQCSFGRCNLFSS